MTIQKPSAPSCSRPETKTVPSGTQVPASSTGWPTDRPGNGSSGPEYVGQGNGLGPGQVARLVGPPGLPRVELPAAQEHRGYHQGQGQQVARPQAQGERRRHVDEGTSLARVPPFAYVTRTVAPNALNALVPTALMARTRQW